MAKLTDSILSGASGRIGRVVVANLFGTEILKVRPKKSSKPATTIQVLIRQRMASSSVFIESYRKYACKHFGHRVGTKSAYNFAMRNLLEAYTIDVPNETITLNYPLVEFSKGSLLSMFPSGFNSPTANTIQINWINNAGTSLDRENDYLQVLVAIDLQPYSLFLENVAQRIDQTVNITLPSTFQNQKVHIWVAFREAHEFQVSNSVYLGNVIVL